MVLFSVWSGDDDDGGGDDSGGDDDGGGTDKGGDDDGGDIDDDGGDDGGDDVDNEKSTYGGFFSLCGVPRLPCEHLLVSSDKGLRVNDDTF